MHQKDGRYQQYDTNKTGHKTKSIRVMSSFYVFFACNVREIEPKMSFYYIYTSIHALWLAENRTVKENGAQF